MGMAGTQKSPDSVFEEGPWGSKGCTVMGPGPALYTAALGLFSNTPLSPLQKAQANNGAQRKRSQLGTVRSTKGCHPIHSGLG